MSEHGYRRDLRFAATRLGRLAAHRGKRITDCPYPRDSHLAAAWVRGYVAEKPVKVDYGD